MIASDADTVIGQRYDGSWKTSAEILEMVESGEIVRIYADQQATFIENGAVDASAALAPEDFVLSDLMLAAGKSSLLKHPGKAVSAFPGSSNFRRPSREQKEQDGSDQSNPQQSMAAAVPAGSDSLLDVAVQQ